MQFEKTSRAATFQATPTPPHATPTLRTGPSSTGQLPPSTPARPPPCCCLEPPKTAGKRSSFGRFSNLSFSLIRPPNQSCEAPGVRPNRRRDLRRVQLARTSSRRSTKETTRAIFPAFAHHQSVKDFGFGQNTGETLPNFRQKSKGTFKKNLKREG
ncbi:LRR and NB-ARC domains-containing disease resistance protein [Prunus dulcis]|uniref:LRR and NB-ARC domains-containing disease resistance protein n=1 Tax=Prunus dulcis TaxID=3755 RepID=A0A4Y1R850_PRUDU|nr:LRR and NB-ARC domains-containing disease resistance protein [Prunus dulcis]